MEKNIVLLKDLNTSKFPVVDILKSESEERLGCATTSLINFSQLLGTFDPDKFSNIAEMALFYELEFGKDLNGGVSAKKCFEVIDEYLKQHEDLERYIYRADTVKYETILFLLINNFIGLVASDTKGDGHCDVVFYQEGKVFYNAFEVNEQELAEIIFSSPHNMLCFARNLKTHKRFSMKASEMGSLTFKLTEDQKHYLTEKEQYMISQNMVEVFCKYPTHKVQELIKEKEYLFKNLGLLDSEILIIYPEPKE